jgi:DNA repair protein RadA
MSKKKVEIDETKTSDSAKEKKSKSKKQYSIEDLPGIGPAISRKLEEADYRTVEAIAVSTAKELAAAAEIGETTASKMIKEARRMLEIGFVTGIEVWDRRKNIGIITTGSPSLNTLLGGGVETGALTEVYGAFRSGKTQLAHQLAVNAQLPPEQGGLTSDSKKVAATVYIDSESTFRPGRIIQMSNAVNLNSKDVLKHIVVGRAYNSDHQMLLVQQISQLAEKYNIKVVVVDSLMSHFRAEYTGRGTLAARQQKLNRHLRQLQRLGDINNYAVFITNQVMSRPDAFFGDPTTFVGGHIVAHSAQTRCYLRRSKGNRRICRLVDSPSLAEGEAVFLITEDGIRDP